MDDDGSSNPPCASFYDQTGNPRHLCVVGTRGKAAYPFRRLRRGHLFAFLGGSDMETMGSDWLFRLAPFVFSREQQPRLTPACFLFWLALSNPRRSACCVRN